MIKPLLHVIPALSGNVTLACNLNDYANNDGIIECHVRSAKLAPLSHEIAQKKCEAGLLTSSYEFDLKKFYAYYSNYFYDSLFSYSEKDYAEFVSEDQMNYRDKDFEFGVKRISPEYNEENMLAFFAPFWCDSEDDIPDYFMIEAVMKNKKHKVTKKIKVLVNDDETYGYNYLIKYLKKYFKQIDSNVIFCRPNENQATYFGIDLLRGGFAKAIDNLIGQNYAWQSSIDKFDENIANGFRRNKLCIKQVMPISFYFDINEALTEKEKSKLKNASVSMSGHWYKNGKKLPFYDFSTDYSSFTQKVWNFRQNGAFEFMESKQNIMDVDYPSLNEARLDNYKYFNTAVKNVTRWKLKYSEDDNPYITNMSFAFSAIQGSQNKYRMFPSMYATSNAFCDSKNNIVLPKNNGLVDSLYSKDSRTLDRYRKAMLANSSSWFDVVDESIPFDDDRCWAPVEDGKTYVHGVLYDLSKVGAHIDKFGVFVKPTLSILDEEGISKIKTSKITGMTGARNISSTNAFLSTDLNEMLVGVPMKDIRNLYINELGVNKQINELTHDTLFIKNSIEEDGDFINLHELGYDTYELNRYYKVSEIIDDTNRRILESSSSRYYISGFEMLPIYYLSQVYASGDFVFSKHKKDTAKWIYDNLHWSTRTNHNKSKYDKNTFQKIAKTNFNDNLENIFYVNADFISAYDYKQLTGDEIDEAQIYEFNPIIVDANETIAANVFTKRKPLIGTNYGDIIPEGKEDLDLIYVDRYNLVNIGFDIDRYDIEEPSGTDSSSGYDDEEQEDASSHEDSPFKEQTFYCKLLNEGHLRAYLIELHKDEHRLTVYDPYESLFIKKRMLINDVGVKDIKVVDNFIAIKEICSDFDFSSTMKAFKFVTNHWEFTDEFINEHEDKIAEMFGDTSLAKFELVFKKTFIKLNKEIWDYISIKDKNKYRDLYLYAIAREKNYPSEIKYFYAEAVDPRYETTAMTLEPLFNDIYIQHRNVTVIYDEFQQNKISEAVCGSDIFYRYDCDNIPFMLDISNFDTYNSYMTCNDTYWLSYSYISNPNNDYTLDSLADPYKILPTYRKMENGSSKICLASEYDDTGIYSKCGLSTYDYNGTTYGMLYIESTFNNTNTSLNLVDINRSDKKVFTSINGSSIYDKSFSISRYFKEIVPFTKINLLETLNKSGIIVKPTLFNITNHWRAFENDHGSMTANYSVNPYGSMALERYFDSITPYIPEASTCTTYSVKYKDTKKTLLKSEEDDVLYRETANIYASSKPRVYSSEAEYRMLNETECKHFNISKFFNLEKEITIDLGDKLLYDEVIERERHENVMSEFASYIRQFTDIDDNGILFLYNRYTTKYDSWPTGVDDEHKNKTYSLKLKFILK